MDANEEQLGGKGKMAVLAGFLAVYSLSYGSLQMKPLTAFDYMLEGACLWEEVECMLKDTMERLIQAHTEWLDNNEYCVI